VAEDDADRRALAAQPETPAPLSRLAVRRQDPRWGVVKRRLSSAAEQELQEPVEASSGEVKCPLHVIIELALDLVAPRRAQENTGTRLVMRWPLRLTSTLRIGVVVDVMHQEHLVRDVNRMLG
jgi:hypothetical protein